MIINKWQARGNKMMNCWFDHEIINQTKLRLQIHLEFCGAENSSASNNKNQNTHIGLTWFKSLNVKTHLVKLIQLDKNPWDAPFMNFTFRPINYCFLPSGLFGFIAAFSLIPLNEHDSTPRELHQFKTEETHTGFLFFLKYVPTGVWIIYVGT